jgi:hypothetical protein
VAVRAWLRKQRREDRLPGHFGDVLAPVVAFARPWQSPARPAASHEPGNRPVDLAATRPRSTHSALSALPQRPPALNESWNESRENCVRLVLSVHTRAASVQAGRSGFRSFPLLIRGSGFKSLAAHPS